jgi:hypothetical protein
MEDRIAALAGVLTGLLGAIVATPHLQSMLYNVRATEPRMFAIAAALLSAVTPAAAWRGSRRAAGIDPVRSFRQT